MDVKLLSSILLFTLIPVSITLIVKILNAVWFRPRKLERLLRKQGVHGNKYRPLLGDMNDFISVMKTEQLKTMEHSDDLPTHMFPYYKNVMNKYGNRSFVWFGPFPRLNISKPELIKEILTKTDVFHKPYPDPIAEKIAGGLLYLEGEKWTKHRKIINPAFHLGKLKIMMPSMLLSCSNMVEKWEALISSSDRNSKEIDVLPYLESFAVETISRTAFGNSHEEGKRIFELQKEEINLVFQLSTSNFIPGWRYFPTKANRRINTIAKEIESLIRGVINRREKAKQSGEMVDNDLLDSLMGSNSKLETQEHGNKSGGMSIKEAIEECKLFYLAGSETTTNLLVWTMVLLSKHREWQARAREEVFRVFGKKEPNFDGLNQLKTVTMILNEVLRMYPPVPLIIRAPTKTIKLGDMILPVGVHLTLLIGLLHHDPEVWGDDVKEFKPERFSQGVSSAVNNQFSFIPFSSGPRVCVGQNFAMLEAKIFLAMIMQRFSFELSPSYVHAPFPILTLQPQYGATLVLHKL
ncbi:cytochrome p450 cyp72a219 [Phtheirospermum japonicum]|uniref:Cytochrome p450 cyp72a219 n=1 Tax=Phtheirospermum japonicum TaxID=374723 RepID=A0A830B9N1_9LAMI|nr:cytochrome p450 cyp72a219 [Phtheirospermum japonicum]